MDTFRVEIENYGGRTIRTVADSVEEIRTICKKYGYKADIWFDGEIKTTADLKNILEKDIKKRKQEAEKSLNAIIDLESVLEVDQI